MRVLCFIISGRDREVRPRPTLIAGSIRCNSLTANLRKKRARLETLTVYGLKVTTVDVAGTYSAEISPGSGTFSSSRGYRLLAAVVETPKGSYYAKLVGPEKTVNRWDQAFTNYVKSFEFK